MSIAVLCSACINSLAVQQLNEKAKEYSEKGKLSTAISRLESSVDLDGNIFESRYNLAVAYVEAKECEKALEQINVAEKLKDSEPSVYYVQGLANGCLAEKVYKTKDGEDVVYNDYNEALKSAKEYINYLKNANNAYEKYIRLTPASDQTQNVTNTIMSNEKLITDYSNKYGISI